jgi:hypothetical protein
MLDMRKVSSTDVQRLIRTYTPPEFPEELVRVTWDFFPTPNIWDINSFAKFL